MVQKRTKHRLAIWRKQKGMTQEEAAVEFGVSKSTLVKWELGLRTPRKAKQRFIDKHTEGQVTPVHWVHC